MRFEDHIKARGHFSLLVTNVIANKSWYHCDDHNTIVLIAKRNVVRLLGANGSGRYISKMRFSAEGHDRNDITKSITTTESTPMGSPLIVISGTNTYKNTDSPPTFIDNIITGMSSSTVRFTCSIEPSEGNGTANSGQIFSQAGLFTENEDQPDPGSGLPTAGLFAIKNFAALVKKDILKFTFSWSITI